VILCTDDAAPPAPADCGLNMDGLRDLSIALRVSQPAAATQQLADPDLAGQES